MYRHKLSQGTAKKQPGAVCEAGGRGCSSLAGHGVTLSAFTTAVGYCFDQAAQSIQDSEHRGQLRLGH